MKIVKLGKHMRTYGTRGRIMSFLTINMNKAFTTREIHKYVGGSLSAVIAEVRHLASTDDVIRQLIPRKGPGRSLIYYTIQKNKRKMQPLHIGDKTVRDLDEVDVLNILISMRDDGELTPTLWEGVIDRSFLIHNHIDDAGLKILFPEQWKQQSKCRDLVKLRKK